MIEAIAKIAALAVLIVFAIGGFVVTNTHDWRVVVMDEKTGARKTRVVRAVTELGAVYQLRHDGVIILEVERI